MSNVTKEGDRSETNKQKTKRKANEYCNEATSVFVCDHRRNIYGDGWKETDSLFFVQKRMHNAQNSIYFEKKQIRGGVGCGLPIIA